MASAKKLLEHLADDTAENFEAVFEQLREDAFALVTLYEAMKVLTADPGQPYQSAQAARDILGLLAKGE